MGALSEKVVGMDGKPFAIIDGKETKLRADGKPKETKSNAKEGGTTWVNPIRDEKDIEKVIKYLQSKIDNENRLDYRRAYARNKLYFCIGVFSGFRVSDLVGARKGTKYKKVTEDGSIYCKDGKKFREEVSIKELKTGKMRKVEINIVMQKYFNEYVECFKVDTTTNDYVFTNRQSEKLSCSTIDQFIKEATSICGIVGNYSTHSLRKTYVYQSYLGFVTEEEESVALATTMKLTGHVHMSDLIRYLGINEKSVEKEKAIFIERMSKLFL